MGSPVLRHGAHRRGPRLSGPAVVHVRPLSVASALSMGSGRRAASGEASLQDHANALICRDLRARRGADASGCRLGRYRQPGLARRQARRPHRRCSRAAGVQLGDQTPAQVAATLRVSQAATYRAR